jgi:hypothetical protein
MHLGSLALAALKALSLRKGDGGGEHVMRLLLRIESHQQRQREAYVFEFVVKSKPPVIPTHVEGEGPAVDVNGAANAAGFRRAVHENRAFVLRKERVWDTHVHGNHGAELLARCPKGDSREGGEGDARNLRIPCHPPRVPAPQKQHASRHSGVAVSKTGARAESLQAHLPIIVAGVVVLRGGRARGITSFSLEDRSRSGPGLSAHVPPSQAECGSPREARCKERRVAALPLWEPHVASNVADKVIRKAREHGTILLFLVAKARQGQLHAPNNSRKGDVGNTR